MSVLDAEQPFNMRQWASDHERRDDERFRLIFAVLAFIGVTSVALLGWSLNNQYTAMQKQVETAQVQLQAIHQVRAELRTVSKEPDLR